MKTFELYNSLVFFIEAHFCVKNYVKLPELLKFNKKLKTLNRTDFSQCVIGGVAVITLAEYRGYHVTYQLEISTMNLILHARRHVRTPGQ